MAWEVSVMKEPKLRIHAKIRGQARPNRDGNVSVHRGPKKYFRERHSPKAFTHISTGVVYASPGVVKMPPCVLHTVASET